MKLIDLEPRWLGDLYGFHTGVIFGLSFLCPHCRKQRLAIFFSNTIGDAAHSHHIPVPSNGKYWTRTGETFETLTLMPSIDASKVGHWHGFIRNGEIQ